MNEHLQALTDELYTRIAMYMYSGKVPELLEDVKETSAKLNSLGYTASYNPKTNALTVTRDYSS